MTNLHTVPIQMMILTDREKCINKQKRTKIFKTLCKEKNNKYKHHCVLLENDILVQKRILVVGCGFQFEIIEQYQEF